MPALVVRSSSPSAQRVDVAPHHGPGGFQRSALSPALRSHRFGSALAHCVPWGVFPSLEMVRGAGVS